MTQAPYTTFALDELSKLIGDLVHEVTTMARARQGTLEEDVRRLRLLTDDLKPLVTMLREIHFSILAGCNCGKAE